MALKWKIKQREGQKGKEDEGGRKETRERKLAKEVKERERQGGKEKK